MSKVGKKRGHQAGLRAVRVVVRLGRDQAVRLDRWRKGLAGNPERPEAMRRLIEALPGSPHRGRRNSETAHKASELAAKAIENLADNLGHVRNERGLSDALFMDQGSFATFAPTGQTGKDDRWWPTR
jgi:hypothetical protein